jgi:hypothetical protein
MESNKGSLTLFFTVDANVFFFYDDGNRDHINGIA